MLEVAHPLATELDAWDQEDLAGHLADCSDCGAWAESERRLDSHVGKAMRAVPMPAGLSQRILSHLEGERNAWYRSLAVRVAGLAAVLLLAICLGYAFWWNWKPGVDLVEVATQVDQHLYSAEMVEESFADKGVIMTAPPQFDYARLELHELVDFQGSKQVPYMLFFYPGGDHGRPAAVAQVYVLSDRQFSNIQEARKQMALPGSRKNVSVLTHPDPARQNVLYVVIYTAGADLRVVFRSPLL